MKTEDESSLSRVQRPPSSADSAKVQAYQALIASVVANLSDNTPQARRVVYQRARTALIGQLTRSDRRIVKSEIERELRALQEATSNVEADEAQRRQQALHAGADDIVPVREELRSPARPTASDRPAARSSASHAGESVPASNAELEREQNNSTQERAQWLGPDRKFSASDRLVLWLEAWRQSNLATGEEQSLSLTGSLASKDVAIKAPNPSPTDLVPEQITDTADDQLQQTPEWSSQISVREATLPDQSCEPEVSQEQAQQPDADDISCAVEQLSANPSEPPPREYEAVRTSDLSNPQALHSSSVETVIACEELSSSLSEPSASEPPAFDTPGQKPELLKLAELQQQVEQQQNTGSAFPTSEKRPTDTDKPPSSENTTVGPQGAEPDSHLPALGIEPIHRRVSNLRRNTRSIVSVTVSVTNRGSESPVEDAGWAGRRTEASLHPRLQAMIEAARYQGVELDPNEYRKAPDEPAPAAAALSLWAQNAGMWARAVRIRWRQLLRFNDTGPVVLLFNDGSAALLTGANANQMVVYLKDPHAPAAAAPVAVDELRLSQVWSGEAVLLRATRGQVPADALFNLRWLADLVLQEHRALRDIGLASLTISILTIFPPLLVMTTVNKVLQFHSTSTLVLLSAILIVVVAYETLLGFARRLIIAVVGARLDAKLNLHMFSRLLRLPLDYFERNPAGDTMYRIAQVHRVREFLTGKLLSTFLDLLTLCVLLPFLFYLNAALAWIVLVCAVVISLIILIYLKPLKVLYSRVVSAETWKSATLGETIVGIKTVKALALEPQRRAQWDERIAEAGKSRLAFMRLSNWPQTLVTPLERLMVLGTMMLGAYWAMNDPSGYMVGGLFAFMMLSGRVAQPLVGLARLMEEYEEVNAAIGEAGSVLNRQLETATGSVGLRPKFSGAISFQDVTFTYASTKLPALDHVSFSVPAGTMLGIVGRSGSGKSTIARLLQGINRDYSGFLKIDGTDLREIELRYLRQNLGVVLQDNFLFRGSIRENIIAGRPGLTLVDAVQAARLAGAEEFIERMPNGYETYIEEGSPNLSGGQRQRLAIARALIHDPRILILDEATSALDPESEAIVSANLLRIANGRTMILVSHRLASLIDCDQVLVMEQGKVTDIAPHAVLLERCAIYRHLWAQQNRHLDSQGPHHAALTPRLVPSA